MCYDTEVLVAPIINPEVIDTTQQAINVVIQGGTPEWVNYLVQAISIIAAAGLSFWFANISNKKSLANQIKFEEVKEIKDYSDNLLMKIEDFLTKNEHYIFNKQSATPIDFNSDRESIQNDLIDIHTTSSILLNKSKYSLLSKSDKNIFEIIHLNITKSAFDVYPDSRFKNNLDEYSKRFKGIIKAKNQAEDILKKFYDSKL